MSTRPDAAGNTVHGSRVEPMCTVCWLGHGPLGWESASTVVRDMRGETSTMLFRSLPVVLRPVLLKTPMIGT